MNLKKNDSFLNFLSESGGYDLQSENPIPLNTWKDEVFIERTTIVQNFSEKNTIKLPKMNSLSEVKSELKNNVVCSLKNYAKNTIIGEGISDSPLLMCIGTAPKTEDDLSGRLFIDDSGKLLDKMLLAIGISREKNAYLTNVSPWRTPANRDLSKEEIDTCLPYLLRQIEIIKPKVILLLGSFPTNAITKKTNGISKLRGNWIDILGIPALTIYSPEHLIRLPLKKKETWSDLLLLKNRPLA